MAGFFLRSERAENAALGEQQTDILVNDAVNLCNELCEKYKNLSKKERVHTERMIFPQAAFYLQMIKYIPLEDSISLTEKSVVIGVEPDRKRLNIATKIPFMRPLFIRFFPKMIDTMFNEEVGFKTKEYEANGKRYRVDVLQFPYVKYCELLGCKELTRTFCLSDDRVFGNMCGIALKRQGTIGRDFDKCDFYFYRD